MSTRQERYGPTRRLRGAAMLEYVLATTMTLGAVLLPFGNDQRSVLARLVEAIQDEHAGFLYAASIPAMPRGSLVAGDVPPGSGAGGNEGAPDPGPSQPGDAGGTPPTSGPGDPSAGGGNSAGGSGGQAGAGDPGQPGGPGTAPGTPADPSPGDPLDPTDLVDADTDSGNGGGSCPVPGLDDADDPFTSASQRSPILSTHVGNPIHVVTGNKYQREVDLHLPALSLSFVRHYNSRRSRSGTLGAGWTHGFDVRLLDQGDRAILWQADGRRIDFSLDTRQDGIRRLYATPRSDGRLVADRGGYTWHWSDGSTLSFDAGRRLRELRDRLGRSLRLVRDAEGRVAQVVNDGSDALRLHYDGEGRLDRLIHGDRVVARYAYDAHGNLDRVKYPDRVIRRYHYEDLRDAHNLTGVSEGASPGFATRIRTWTYDDDDRAVVSLNAQTGAEVRLEFLAGDTTRVIVGDAAPTLYRSTRRQGVPLVTRIEGADCTGCGGRGGVADITRYRYGDGLGIEQIATLAHGTRRYERDALGRLERITHTAAAGTTSTLLGIRYREGSDDIERIARPSLKPGSEHAITLRYRDDGQIAERIESGFAPLPDGGWTPIRRNQRFDFEESRLVAASSFDPDHDRPTRVVDGPGGLGSGVVLPDGGSLRVLAWDEAGRPRQIQADSDRPLTLDYGTDGRLTEVRSEGRAVQLVYGDDDALIGLRDAARPALAFPPRAMRTDSRGAAPPLPRQAPAELRRDPRGNLVAVTAANGATTRYGFDDFGRQVFEASSDAGLISHAYDGENRRVGLRDTVGGAAQFAYGDDQQLARIVLPEETWRLVRTNGENGVLTNAMDYPAGSETVETDAAGRTIQRTTTIGERTYVTRSRYGADGELLARTLLDGRTLRFAYQREGRREPELSSIAEAGWIREHPLLAGLQSDASGTQWTTASGITTRAARDDGRLMRLRIGALHDFTYHHDHAGRIDGIDDGNRIQARYRYDALGRLDIALTPSLLLGFRYDLNGNRTRLVENGRHYQYDYAPGSNRLLATAPASSAWAAPMRADTASVLGGFIDLDRGDAAAISLVVRHRSGGEIESMGRLRWVHDAVGRATEVWARDRLLARYRYDTRHRRIVKQRFDERGRAIEERHYLYEDDQLAAEADGSGSIQVQYVYIGRQPVAMLTADARYFIHANHLGAPIAVSDMQRRVVWRASYEPFGRARVDEDPDRDGQRFTSNLRLPGQYEDIETGVYYNHHRYYDPDLGRYLSPDPLGLEGGLNPYVYAGNDPINHIDPSGLLLFAFDGSGNNDPALERRDLSNVVKFRDSYVGDPGELGVRDSNGDVSDQHYYYISGPGTRDARSGISGDSYYDNLTGKTMIDRVAALANDFFRHLVWMKINRQSGLDLNIDTIGFSRGAVEARIFVNLLTAFLDGKDHFVLDHTSGRRYEFGYGDPEYTRRYLEDSCVHINLRFLGLWDSVPHYSANQPYLDAAGTSQDDDLRELELQVDPADDPNAIQYVAHAVAVNENRRDFHAVSIHMHPQKGNTESRMEMGFIGAHADVGGGYSEGDLSDVALMWMIKRAQISGASLALNGRAKDWAKVTSPVLHDSSDTRIFFIKGRKFKYLNDIDEVLQRDWYSTFPDSNAYGMTHRTAASGYFGEEYKSGPPGTRGTADHDGNDTLVGIVNASKYADWLLRNYDLEIPISEVGLDENRRPPQVTP